MGYEDSVYLAKLAEQAERYEGTHEQLTTLTLRIAKNGQRWSTI